jgi:hypothetical protein
MGMKVAHTCPLIDEFPTGLRERGPIAIPRWKHMIRYDRILHTCSPTEILRGGHVIGLKVRVDRTWKSWLYLALYTLGFFSTTGADYYSTKTSKSRK